ncbi:MAG: peptidoglycan-binding protein, partial [Nitrospinaceae bacterium]
MRELSYKHQDLVLKRRGAQGSKRQIQDLQRDLRRLGYLRSGVDGKFGPGTERAVKALQHDLLANDGKSNRADGDAPIAIIDYNRGRVADVDGEVDFGLAGCIGSLLHCSRYPKLPASQDPEEDNAQVRRQIHSMKSQKVPVPFLMAILRQESGLKQFNEPHAPDEDSFVVVGLDTNAAEAHVITSRGYGAGQYTLFHHPPSHDEVADFINDWKKNLKRAVKELRAKFDRFVNGPTSGTRADDRTAEMGDGPLKICKYAANDPLYMKDCLQCAKDAGLEDIQSGVTPFYEDAAHTYRPTQYYKTGSYKNVP